MLRVYPPTFSPQDSLTTGSIGFLSFIMDDEVKQAINGDWCLTFSYPIALPGADLVALDNLVLAQGQLYRIRRIRTVDSAGKQLYEVEAPHLAWDLQNYCIENIETDDTELDGIRADVALAQVLEGTPFSVGTVDVDMTHLDYLDILQQNVMEALKQIVELWGGELFFDNFTVNLLSQCGQERNYGIRQGKNISDLKYTEDMAGVITRLHIIGYGGADIKDINDGKDYIDSQYINNYSHIYEGYVTFDDEDLPEELLRLGQQHLATVEVPQISMDISLVNLQGSPQYRFYRGLEIYELGDTAILHHDALATDFTLRCQERTFIAHSGVNTQVKLGNTQDELSAAFSSTVTAAKAIQEVIGPHNTLKATRIHGVIDALKTQLYASSAYESAEVMDNRGVLFENTNPESSDYGAMYIGPGMFAIANTKTGNAWDWRTFGNGSGFSADVINTGVLSADHIDVANMDLGLNQQFSIAMGIINSMLISPDGAMSQVQQAVDRLEETLTDENGEFFRLKRTVDGLEAYQSEQQTYLRYVDGVLELGKDGENAVFQADNRSLGVTNIKTERLGIAQTMDQDEEWVWIATRTGIGLKYVGE